MKIILNKCYGEFSLDEEIVEKYLPKEEIEKELHHEWLFNSYFLNDHNSKIRKNPILIELIEKIGSYAVSGAEAQLDVVEVAPGAQFIIKNNDGYEEILTPNDLHWEVAT